MKSENLGEPSDREVRFEAAVDRSLVHRSAVSEVFVTDVVRRASDDFDCGVQWPRRHTMYRAPDDSVDGSLVAETIRQLTIAVAHLGYGVAGDEHFLMSGMRFRVAAERLRTAPVPAELIATVTVDGVRRSAGGRSQALRASVTLNADGRPIAKGRGDAAIVPDVAYRRLRGAAGAVTSLGRDRSGGEPAPAADVGAARDEDVVVAKLEPTEGWSIVVDPAHPIYFDHPLDHVPGMLLIDAMRQAARLHIRTPDLDFSEFEAEFSRVVELSSAASVRASGDREALAFEIVQSGRVAAVAAGVGRTTRPARPASSGRAGGDL
ncbi:ScbA/BarX family gamma-butyrolactone biosynthesis protein [Leifsonia sp. NPDC058292]|uniref:ScbA/BarX family gamma-butyrolactone biosynthesis protein n=1 Tax=Leifsonia sp. NPDC058292 TaxID=3346428 RepID=UPI0036DF2BBA